MSDPIDVTASGTSVSVSVGSGIGPQGPAGPQGPPGPVSSVQGLTGAVTLVVTGGTVTTSGSTITLAVSAATVDWSSITGKPATFAPSAHSHAIADVTGLQAALDAKQASGSYAAASHTHTAAAVTDFDAAALAAVTWSTITGKPATFTPATHSHVIADVAGLQTALDGKQAAGSYAAAAHGHVIADVTGLQAALDGKQASGSYAAASHTHGNLTNAGAIGSNSGLIVVTGAGGVLTTASTISASAVSGLGTLATQSGTFSGTSSGVNTGDQTITLTGDVTGSGTGTFAATLSASGVTAGTYRSVTVDAKGRVTAGTNPTTLSGYGITDAVSSSDARLTDTRTPTAGTVTDAAITSGGLSASSINWVGITAWAPSTAYAKGDLVEYLGVAYRRSAAGTSGATFNTANWQQVTPTAFVASQITSGTLGIDRLTARARVASRVYLWSSFR